MAGRTTVLIMLGAALAVSPAGAQTLVAARPIERGAVISSDAVNIRAGPAPAGVLASPDDAVGRIARRALAPGVPIRADALAAAPAVRRGMPVLLVARVGGARIEAGGIAEADAPAGSPVTARNRATGTRVRGMVTQSGTIEIFP